MVVGHMAEPVPIGRDPTAQFTLGKFGIPQRGICGGVVWVEPDRLLVQGNSPVQVALVRENHPVLVPVQADVGQEPDDLRIANGGTVKVLPGSVSRAKLGVRPRVLRGGPDKFSSGRQCRVKVTAISEGYAQLLV